MKSFGYNKGGLGCSFHVTLLGSQAWLAALSLALMGRYGLGRGAGSGF